MTTEQKRSTQSSLSQESAVSPEAQSNKTDEQVYIENSEALLEKISVFAAAFGNQNKPIRVSSLDTLRQKK